MRLLYPGEERNQTVWLPDRKCPNLLTLRLNEQLEAMTSL